MADLVCRHRPTLRGSAPRAEAPGIKVAVLFSPAELAHLDAVAEAQDVTRSEAIRRAVAACSR